jgi:hypothetical protein
LEVINSHLIKRTAADFVAVDKKPQRLTQQLDGTDRRPESPPIAGIFIGIKEHLQHAPLGDADLALGAARGGLLQLSDALRYRRILASFAAPTRMEPGVDASNPASR